jgi:hypothetical protein
MTGVPQPLSGFELCEWIALDELRRNIPDPQPKSDGFDTLDDDATPGKRMVLPRAKARRR